MTTIGTSKGTRWDIGEQIGQGGFGRVFLATSSGHPTSVAKFIPKEPGADRELLFEDLTGVRNVVPIIGTGSTEHDWVLIMPKADMSLKDYLDTIPTGLDLNDAKTILADIATSLKDLSARDNPVVHRDLKPANVLLLDGLWCLADFGIARYAEASTAADTRKEIMSIRYAAPERWHLERATPKTDIYSLGVIAYILLTGSLPFDGDNREELRELHLHTDPPILEGVPFSLAALVSECLYKSPEARPSASGFLDRLSRVSSQIPTPGLASLQAANLEAVKRKATQERKMSELKTENSRREGLFQAARG
ncbi:MAG: serine/threonine-protein kinase [Thermomicrobiales bacterium]